MKPLLIRIQKRGGRNAQGRITIRHRGGGMRKIWRVVDFGQEHAGVPGKVEAIEYDPNRNAFVAKVKYQDGNVGYILASAELKPGAQVLCAEKTEIKPGSRLQLQYIPIGTPVHNIEVQPGKGGKLVRGAGSAALVVAQEGDFTHIQLPSSEVRKVYHSSYASVGAVSNPEYQYHVIGKAGSRRLKGWRPKVRGTVMNPVDHPHGGGEGRTGRGMKSPKTKWGKVFFGIKTRRKTPFDTFIIQRKTKKK